MAGKLRLHAFCHDSILVFGVGDHQRGLHYPEQILEKATNCSFLFAPKEMALLNYLLRIVEKSQ